MESPQPAIRPNRFSFESVANFLKKTWRGYLFLFLAAGGIIALDQWTKALVRKNIPFGTDWLPGWLSWLEPYARVRHWFNSGAAFGIFQNGNLIFTVLAIIVALLIIYYYPRVAGEDWWLKVAMSMQFAGAVGNLIDRLIFKQVTDFLSVGEFAVFNVADSSITVGVAVLILWVWIKERAEKKAAAAASKVSEVAPAPSENETKSE
jgi:signal peptidase II